MIPNIQRELNARFAETGTAQHSGRKRIVKISKYGAVTKSMRKETAPRHT